MRGNHLLEEAVVSTGKWLAVLLLILTCAVLSVWLVRRNAPVAVDVPREQDTSRKSKWKQWEYRDPSHPESALVVRAREEAPLPADSRYPSHWKELPEIAARHKPFRDWLLAIVEDDRESGTWRWAACSVLPFMQEQEALAESLHALIYWLDRSRPKTRQDWFFRLALRQRLFGYALLMEPSDLSLQVVQHLFPDRWREGLAGAARSVAPSTPPEMDSPTEKRLRAQTTAAAAALLREAGMGDREGSGFGPPNAALEETPLPQQEGMGKDGRPHESAEHAIELHSVLGRADIHLGEPVFLQLVLVNVGERPVDVWLSSTRTFSASGSYLEMFPPDGAEKGDSQHRALPIPTAPVTDRRYQLDPGERLFEHHTLWSLIPGECIPSEGTLLFHSPGVYRYLVHVLVRVRGKRTGQKLQLASEGDLTVKEQLDGFPKMMRGFEMLLGDGLEPRSVRFQDRGGLDTLIAELGASQYAEYAKWLRVRTVLTGPGLDFLEQRNEAAQIEARRLDELVAQLVKGGTSATPVARDALTCKALVSLLRDNRDQAEAIVTALAERYTDTYAMRKLRMWLF